LKNIHKGEIPKVDINRDKFNIMSEKEQEEIKNSIKMQLKLEYESMNRWQDMQKNQTVAKNEIAPKEQKDRGCLYLSILLTILTVILIGFAGNWELGRSISIGVGGLICFLIVMFGFVKVADMFKD